MDSYYLIEGGGFSKSYNHTSQLILAFSGYPIYPKEKKIRKFEFWARSGWSQNVRQIIFVRELTCHAFYTSAPDWDIWGKPIPRYDTNTFLVLYCVVWYGIYGMVSCRVVSYRIVPINPSWEGALRNGSHRLLRLVALLQA